jgi:glycosyltransferase involved in cell wall biosynthesis
MKQNKFTIIIPTRERADTLYWCLKTLVEQNYENLEILVSDNFSQDNTREVVDSFDDKRIRYINTGKSLDMSGNWEFALNHVTDLDSYIGFVGDDDSYLPHTINTLNNLLNAYEVDGITWASASFNWLNTKTDSFDPVFHIPVASNTLEVRDAKRWYKKLCQLNISVHQVMYVYGLGIAKFSLFKEVQQYYGGVFFRSAMPDMLACCLLTKNAKNYLYVDSVLSAWGSSKKANSTAGHKVVSEFTKERNGDIIHRTLGNKLIYAWVFFIADGILHAEEDNNQKIKDSKVKQIIETIMKEVFNEMNFQPINRYNEVIALIGNFINDLYPSYKQKWKSLVLKNPNLFVDNLAREQLGINPYFFKAQSEFLKLENIYEASLFCYVFSHGTNPKLSFMNPIKTPKNIFLYKKLSKLKYYLGRVIEKYIL